MPPHNHAGAAGASTAADSARLGAANQATVRHDLQPRDRRALALAEVERRVEHVRQELMRLRGDEEESRHLQRAEHPYQVQQAPDHALREPQSGDQSGHWYKVRELGHGSFARVFRGFWWKPHGGVEFIAIKELNQGKMQQQEQNRRTMEREVRVMSRLKHTNLIRMYNYSITAALSYILMEYCPDGTLRDMSDSCAAAHHLPYKVRVCDAKSGVIIKGRRGGGGGWKRYVQSTVVGYLTQILRGLQHMHERNMLHRDVKTSNILLADHGRCAKISDFGETHAAEEGQVPSVRWNDAFTPGHAAPEFFWLNAAKYPHLQRKAQEQAAHAYQADVWSFGCLAVELITGHHPEIFLFEMRGMEKSLQNPLARVFKSCNWALSDPAALRLDFLEHPLIKTLPECASILDFLNACFEIEPKDRKSAAQLLDMPLLQKGRQTHF